MLYVLYVVNAFAYQNIIMHKMENMVTKGTVADAVAASAAIAFFCSLVTHTHLFTIDGCVSAAFVAISF